VTKDLNLGSTNMPSGNRYKTSGSNAWAIHGNHTKSGRSIIANDPHLALIIPTTFYISEWILIN
jgi:penicillin amidase